MILAPAPTQVTFAAGAAAASLTVATVDDTVAEDDSIIQVGVIVDKTYPISSGSATLSVLDDDSSLPSRGDLTFAAGAAAASLTVATVDDTVAEDDSIIQVNVDQPSSSGLGSVAETLTVPSARSEERPWAR